MENVVLYDQDDHQFILLNESEPGLENGIQSNQYLILHKGNGVLLDPGGFNVMPKVLAEMLKFVTPGQIKGIILSHQDPDIVAGIPTWLKMLDVPIYAPHIWLRFLPHYGINQIDRFIGIPDEGTMLTISDEFHLNVIPAHFLHSEGNINVYDPISKILFSGDIGSAIMSHENNDTFVVNFQNHLNHIEWFHRRYMGCNNAIIAWEKRISSLEIDMMAPQHGLIYPKTVFKQFIDWMKELKCGTDLINEAGFYKWD